jgi:hypothetical protein
LIWRLGRHHLTEASSSNLDGIPARNWHLPDLIADLILHESDRRHERVVTRERKPLPRLPARNVQPPETSPRTVGPAARKQDLVAVGHQRRTRSIERSIGEPLGFADGSQTLS